MWRSALLVGLLVLAGCATPEGMMRRDYFGFRNHVPEREEPSPAVEEPARGVPMESRASRPWSAPPTCSYTVVVPEWGYADWYAPWYGVLGCCAGYEAWCWHAHGWYSWGWRCYGYRRCAPRVVVVVPTEVVRPAVRSVRTFGPQRGSVEQWREERESAGSAGAGGRRRMQAEQGTPAQGTVRAQPVEAESATAKQVEQPQGGRRRGVKRSESNAGVEVRTEKRTTEDGGRSRDGRRRQESLQGSSGPAEPSGGGRSRAQRPD